MAESLIHSHFCYKACCLRELKDIKDDEPLRVQVEIAANRDLAGRDPQGVTRCLLVTTRSIRGGVLVNSEGHDYARYAADIRDKSALDLRDVPVDHYDLKLRQPRDRQVQR